MVNNEYLLNKDDFSKYRDLFFYSFNMKDHGYENNLLKQEFTHAPVYGIKSDGELMTSVTCLPFTVNFFGRSFKMAGVGNVMSAPEYLQSNGIDTLMKQAFEDMHQNNITLSYLGPFSYDYYRRFGYEQVFENKIIKIPFAKFAKHKGAMTGHLQKIEYLKAKNIIGDIFERHNHFGGVRRDEWWWQTANFWSNDWQLVVSYDEANKIDGYIVYEQNDTEFIVKDMIYETSNAFLKLNHFIGKHRSIYKTLIIESADTSVKVNQFVTNPLDTVTTIQPEMMARIVDLKYFMLNYPVAEDELHGINIKVLDSLSWNEHIWKLSIADGQVRFVECDDEKPDLIVDIQTLTKALFNYQSLLGSAMVGDVQGDIEKIRELDGVFVREAVQLKEEF